MLGGVGNVSADGSCRRMRGVLHKDIGGGGGLMCQLLEAAE
jgi:hypothetical protein